MADTLTLIEKTVHMKSSDVFSAIPTEPLAQLAARANEVMLDRGETVFREGDDDQGVFIVIEGVVELRKGNEVVRVLRTSTANCFCRRVGHTGTRRSPARTRVCSRWGVMMCSTRSLVPRIRGRDGSGPRASEPYAHGAGERTREAVGVTRCPNRPTDRWREHRTSSARSTATQTSRVVAPRRTSGCESDVFRSLIPHSHTTSSASWHMPSGYEATHPELCNLQTSSAYAHFWDVLLRDVSDTQSAGGESRNNDGSERIRNRADFGTQDALLTNCYCAPAEGRI